jgi:transcriptional regulator with XRE-family HTH domain
MTRAEAREAFYGETMAMLRSALQAAGVSQRELARRLGVSEGRVSHLLHGTERTSNTTLKAIADVAWAIGVELEVTIK